MFPFEIVSPSESLESEFGDRRIAIIDRGASGYPGVVGLTAPDSGLGDSFRVVWGYKTGCHLLT